MTRIHTLIVAAALAALLPATAEAKRRFGGAKPAAPAAAATTAKPGVAAGVAAGAIVAPRIGRASQQSGQPGQPAGDGRVPFPPAVNVAEPTLLRLTTAEAPKTWCAGEKVVGGFCVVN